MKISLIITTYNRPDALAAVLESVLAQKRMPDEVIVGDDGSGPETREMLREYESRFPVPLVHVWHADKGFRLAEIRNKCIARATGDYIIQTDGDIIMLPHFVADHAALARRGYFARGVRVRLSAARSAEICRSGRPPKRVSVFSRGLLRDRLKAWRLPWVGRVISYRRKTTCGAIGCNMAFWRDDLVRVNGYDDCFTGWGYEDTDLLMRLMAAGVRMMRPYRMALCLHLWHPEKSKHDAPEARAYMESKMARGELRPAHGLADHL
ncbi:MAG: glycosyltransferase family 2 protein [Muribaculaceae bacterium]|nr:glycosyltransferase family 2 protein [Muribaculaceae bacterium]